MECLRSFSKNVSSLPQSEKKCLNFCILLCPWICLLYAMPNLICSFCGVECCPVFWTHCIVFLSRFAHLHSKLWMWCFDTRLVAAVLEDWSFSVHPIWVAVIVDCDAKNWLQFQTTWLMEELPWELRSGLMSQFLLCFG